MSSEELRLTGEPRNRSEGEDAEAVSPESGGTRGESDGASSVGMADIQATLAKLEEQIGAYRRMLAEQEVAASLERTEADREAKKEASPLGGIDEEELGDVAESIASDYVAFFAGLDAVAEAAVKGERDSVDSEVEQVASDAVEVESAVELKPVKAAVVAADDVTEVEVEEEEVGLAEPSVVLPELFGELESQLAMGLHRNASVAVYENGEEHLVYLSSDTGSGVTPEPQPLFRAFSSGKAMAAAVIWRLLDAGVVGIDSPVVDYWPGFAQRGKSKVTVRHVLTHTAGLPRDYGRGDVDWGDWGRMSDILASMDLEYEPGKVIHYHAITFGLLVGEIASRATGVAFEELFDREVRDPLGLVDTRFSIGADDVDARSRVRRLYTADDYHDLEMPMKMDWLLDNQIVSPGASCVTSARDLGRLYAAVCNGGVGCDGEVWLSAGAASNVFSTHASAYNIEEMARVRVGQGVWMFDDQPNRMGAPSGSMAFGHGGMGSSIAWGDPENGVSVAIITDTMQDEELNGTRLNRISAAVRRDMGLEVGVVAEF